MYFNSAEKGITPGDTWHARRVPGVVSRCGGSRGAAHSESSREGLSRLGHAGHAAGSGAPGEAPGESVFGTRVVLAGLPDVVYGLSIRGQVACSATSEGSLPAGVLGDRCRVRRLPG